MREAFHHLAVTEGFEPSVACTTHAFQACSFGRSDTSPGNNLSILSDRASVLRHVAALCGRLRVGALRIAERSQR